MGKKKQIPLPDSSTEVFHTGRRLGLILSCEKDYQCSGEFLPEKVSSFTLGDMFLSLEDDSREDAGEEFSHVSEDHYDHDNFRDSPVKRENEISNTCSICHQDCVCGNTSQKRIQDFSIPKSLERKKCPRLQSHVDKPSSLVYDYKNNTECSRTTISDDLSFSQSHDGLLNASFEVSDNVIPSNDLILSKKNQKKQLSPSIAKFYDSVNSNKLDVVSKGIDKAHLSKIPKNKFHDGLSWDLDFYDNDESIFHFDRDDSLSISSFKESNEGDTKDKLDMDELKVKDERTRSIIIEENPQACHISSKEAHVSSYSDDKEDLFCIEDFQNENFYNPLFKTQTYDRYSSSDDMWSFYSSSFVSKTSETNDVMDMNQTFDDRFFKNDFSTSNENGDTTDEDQNFIIKKITQKNEIETSNGNLEKKDAYSGETCNNTLAFRDSNSSELIGKVNPKLSPISITTYSEDSQVTSNTINKPPILGTWIRDLKRPMAIIDGISTNVINPVTPSCTILSPASTNLSPSSIPSLDDILDTSAFVQLSSSHSSSSSITKSYLSDFYRWEKIPIGTFRRHQQRFTNTRDELIKGEWYALTSKSRRQRSNVPILGTTVHHKKNRQRKQKHRNKLKNSIDFFEQDEESGREQCGLGLGPQLSPLFNGLS